MIRQDRNVFRELVLVSLVALFSFIDLNAKAQESFADKCLGSWEGTMYIYGGGKLRDSVPVQLTVQKTTLPDTWIWRTSYLSKTTPMEKNYKLVLKDAPSQTYVTDEGDGIELMNYRFNNKLYSVFETHDVMLTSSYTLEGDQLTFEVTSGRKMNEGKEVTNYSVLNLQRVIFKRVRK